MTSVTLKYSVEKYRNDSLLIMGLHCPPHSHPHYQRVAACAQIPVQQRLTAKIQVHSRENSSPTTNHLRSRMFIASLYT
jgi:hypothetical protein